MRENVPLAPYTTLKAGGPAEWFTVARTVDELAGTSLDAQKEGTAVTILGSGSNMLPSDAGVPGLTILDLANEIHIDGQDVTADCGCAFQELFLKTVQNGLKGLEFAVGIPGTLGGALVSNAGAYRSNVSEFLMELEVVHGAERKWVGPSFMQFSYRDSILRRTDPPPCTLLRAKLRLPQGDPKASYDEARGYQRQRISKQPPPASAGSFFKNVNDRALAESLETLPDPLKKAGVVPSGYLIEAVGLKGHRKGRVAFAPKHANFIINVGGASAFEIRDLAEFGKAKVREKFNVTLEEEVLYLGDWSGYSKSDANKRFQS
ncbi:MAG TPA: UDP-N-acetylmuramate dehydrogenase [Fimbriimonadaceae bacterium]|nr:UDP-N-acetylmuramate dehydrogenase [Fimbriimonadaceae bacterium]